MENFLYERIIRKVLFAFDPETIHNIAIKELKLLSYLRIYKRIVSKLFDVSMPLEVKGIKFKNPIGLAAGFDKNGEVYDVLECLGFGFIEIGSVTLNPQAGNPKPRLWRIEEENAIINHFGLNNIGAYNLLKNIEKKGKPKIPLGINIAKDNDCDFDKADKNIATSFKILKDCGDFFVINISCPNVSGPYLKSSGEYVSRIIESIKEIDEKKPLFIKISPDFSDDYISEIVRICDKTDTGIVAINTSKRRDIIKTDKFNNIEGGVSGKPIGKISLETLKKIRDTSKKVDIISCGGIFEKNDIDERKKFGVNLFEIYTSFIYRGPSLIKRLLNQ